ncbi:MAG: aromatic ring-hydroxylating dioxygenase subunit alpha [Hydrogenophaga sp.]|jgi:phenylpropionate dioxygenase-like ring-hydroxylating dioxygenase large terminal subunit|nr:aromatic ring-hydroxylating dioxygenase subunit alpha [Hydrogenophaga sp.]
MIERELWHPVVASMHLRDEPVAVALLGESLVLWREPGHDGAPGVVHAWADRCPHRGAKLSLGRVLHHLHGSRLECPYHGWQFGGDAAVAPTGAACGRCVHVPAAPAFEPPASHSATVFEALERHGLVWVRLERPDLSQLPAALSQPPAFEPWSDPVWRQLIGGPYEVQTSAPRLVENFLDLSHFGFVHEGWLGARSHAQVETGRVEEGAHGLQANDCRAWQPRAYAGASGGGWVAYRYTVPHPFAAILRKDAAEGDPVSNAIALFIRPDGPEACTAWFAMATLGDLSDDEELRAFQDAVFAQDRPVVESQQPKALPIGRDGPAVEVHSPADRMSAAYRRYLLRLGVTLGVC